MKILKVVNTKKFRFEDFMETFFESVIRIADGIDFDIFVESASFSVSSDDVRENFYFDMPSVSCMKFRLLLLVVTFVVRCG